MASNSNAGRPTGYKTEYASIAEKACLAGATDEELAEILDVSTRTLYRWKTEYPEFCQAIKAGKDAADERVVRSLYKRAVGFESDAVKIFMPSGAEEPVYAPYKEYHAPDVGAATMWLTNRDPDRWKAKTSKELTGPNGGPIETKEILDGRVAARRAAFLIRAAKARGGAGTPRASGTGDGAS